MSTSVEEKFRPHGEQIPGKGRVSRRSPERKLLDSLTLEGICSPWRWYFRFIHFTTADLNHRNERLHSYFYTLINYENSLKKMSGWT